MEKNISISICVPALNEEKSLAAAVEDLLQDLSSYVQKVEVIIVDDGSTDSTGHLADRLAKEYSQVKVIHHEKRLGIGVCYRDALALAEGDYFSWFPGDHENSAEEFIRCLPYLSKNVIVACHHNGQDPRSILRRSISHGYTWILNKSLRLDLKYYNGLAVFPISALRSFSLVADGFLFTAEGLVKAIHRGCRVTELPIPLKKRIRGRSKAFTFLSLIQIIKDLSRVLLYTEEKNKILHHRERKSQ